MDRTADALIGRVLDGRYRVGPKIARGGMAGVYEATDLRLDRTVAVKVISVPYSASDAAPGPSSAMRFASAC